MMVLISPPHVCMHAERGSPAAPGTPTSPGAANAASSPPKESPAAASVAAAVQDWEPFASAAPASNTVSPTAAAPASNNVSSPKPIGDAVPAGWGAQMDAGHLFEQREEEDLDRHAKQGFKPQLVMSMGTRMFPQAGSPSGSPSK